MQVNKSTLPYVSPAIYYVCYWMILTLIISLNIFSCTNESNETNRYWEIYEYESYSQDSSIGLSLSYPQFSFENEIARSFLDSVVMSTIGELSNMTYDKLSIDEEFAQPSHIVVKKIRPEIIGQNLLQLTKYSYEYIGGVHGVYGYDFVIVDLESIEIVVLDHFISPIYYSGLIELGIDNFKHDNDIDPNDKLTEDYWFENSMYSNLYLPNEFFVDEDGMSFLYQIYEIASYAQGNVVLNYSWSDLEDVMDKTLYNRLTRNRKTIIESDIGRTQRHYHSPIDKFLQSYFDCFISKDILAKCNGEYYADKLIKFHDHSNITREKANKLDKQDFTKNEISSYEIRFPSEKSINAYRNFTVVKRLPLDYVITKKNGRKINYITELDIAFQNNPLKIMAIGKDVDLSDLVDAPDEYYKSKNEISNYENSISGDFNGDGKTDYMWLEAPQIDESGPELWCKGDCICYIQFSDVNIPPIKIDQCIGGVPDNLNDLNNDGKDEIGLKPGWFSSCWRSYFTWSLQNDQWVYLVDPIETHCVQWEQGIKPIEKDNKFSNRVIVNYTSADLEIKSKTVQVSDLADKEDVFRQTKNKYVNDGDKKMELEDYRGAIQEYNKAIEQFPGFAEAYTKRGNAKSYSEDYLGAIQDCNKAIQLNPGDAIAYQVRGISKLNLEDYIGAIEDFNKAIQLNPDYGDAYLGRALVKYELKDIYGACQDFKKAGQLGLEVEWMMNIFCN